MLQKSKFFLTVLILMVFLAACSSASEPTTLETTFTAANNTFAGPETLSAGWTKVTLINEGPEPYHLQFVRLDADKTVDDLVAAMSEDPENFPDWAMPLGGPNAPDPGGQTVAHVNLLAGSYALIDLIPNGEGVPHFLTGMTKTLTVIPNEEPAAEPESETTIELNDFSFAISGEFTTGKHTLRFHNAGTQPHEAVLVKLADGKTADDYLNTPPGTPPPALSLGGITGIEPGANQYIDVTFEPGNYALFCFFPDPTSHAPHFALGMIHEFTVK